ncbi:MAG TPA: hypothetical protein VGE27_01205 [Gemmatimonas sp.]|uniref:hypothetical protein n=1 Tax=Gemmatimonas sp. TaxID=1962908 RepID=UPI002ED8F2D1
MQQNPVKALLLVVACFVTWNDAQAQEPASPPWLAGASVGLTAGPGHRASQTALVSVHWTHYRPNRLTLDATLGIMPRALLDGALGVMARPALTVPITVTRDVLVLPLAGVSVSGAATRWGSGSAVGYHTGMAVMWFDRANFGLRLGATRHTFSRDSRPFWLIEAGLTKRR